MASFLTQPSKTTRVVVAVIGKDRPGIVFKVARAISAVEGNIVDISQTLLQLTFTMTMIVDLASADDFGKLSGELKKLEEEMHLTILLQKEEIFLAMHRV